MSAPRTPHSMPRSAALGVVASLGVAASLMALVGCAQTLHVRTAQAAHVTLDGQDLGEVDEEGVDVELPRSDAPIPYTMVRGDETRSGEIERGPVSAWADAGLIGCAASTSVCCGAAGCIMVNPTCLGNAAGLVFPPLLFTGLFVTTGVFATAPGWLTAPATCAGVATGAFPLLGLTLLPQNAPDEIVLSFDGEPHEPPPPPAASEDDDAE